MTFPPQAPRRLALALAVGAAVIAAPWSAASQDFGAPAEPNPGQPAELGPEAAGWVDSTLAELDLRERAAQLVFPWVRGGYLSTRSARYDSLAALVDAGVGGVNVSIGLPHEIAARVNALQRRAEVPLLVTSDFESGGPGMRLNGVYALPSLLSLGGGTEFPSTMGFGAIGTRRMARAYGRVTGSEARAVGVHLNFAPVVDVNSDPANPVINTRSFGESPDQVGRLAEAYVRGAREAGVLTTAKHFPGHGDTETDSHVDLPVVRGDRARLDSVELPPFRRAVEAGVDAVMTAHVAVPALTGSGLPATFSPAVNDSLLREEMGFRGLVVTDALTMGALRRSYGSGTAAVRALRAGADVLLDPPEPLLAIDSVVAAVRAGRVPRTRLDSAARRVLAAKAKAGLHAGRITPLDSVGDVVGREEHRALADTAATGALTLVRDRRGLVPLDTARFRRAFSLTLARERHLAAGRAFDARLRRGLSAGASTARVTPETPRAVYDSLATRARRAPLVLLSVYLPPRAGAGSVALPDAYRAFARELVDGPTPVVLLSFGSPYLLSDLPDVTAYLAAWGGSEPSQRAAARALLGRAELTGRLPVSLPPRHARGEGLRRTGAPALRRSDGPREVGMRAAPLAHADSLIRAAIRDSVTPGAALAVGRRGRLVRLRGYGRLDWDPDARTVTDSTIYDLASLTKANGTSTALMSLVEEGRVDLGAPVAAYLPWFTGGGKSSITVGQLLRHRGGLPPFRAWWRELEGRDAYRRALSEVETAFAPGDSTAYSDLGFMALGMLVEEVAGRGLDRYLSEEVFAPLGMSDTGFRPDSSLLPRIAPTEVDTVFRDGHVRGVVHDENAYAMGGVAGHAGLFSSVRDLAVFARLLVNGGWTSPRDRSAAGGGSPPAQAGPSAGAGPSGPRLVRLLGAATVRRFTRPGPGDAARGLGWETGAPGEGATFGPRSFGHTGFTGTSLWVDPARELFVVLLTNRLNPSREGSGHVELRRRVHRAVAEAVVAVDSGPPRPR